MRISGWSGGLAYLASPYSRRDNLDDAFDEAAKLAAVLTCCGVKVYSPIVHGHAIMRAGNLDPHDLELYVPLNMAMIPIFDALIVAHLEGWQSSIGTADEIKQFEKARKQIFDLNPETLVMTRRRGPLVYEPVNQVHVALARIAELDAAIAAYPYWGGSLTAMDEERKELVSFVARQTPSLAHNKTPREQGGASA